MAPASYKVKSVYVASPLGFSEAGRVFYKTLVGELQLLGLEVIDPWTLTPQQKIDKVTKMKFGQKQKTAWGKLNKVIGRNNANGLDRADMVVAVLDGVDVDSGTASEIGYAAAKGKFIEGYRGDFRLSADNIGSIVNLQVEYFIRESGGKISFTLNELIEGIKKKYILRGKHSK